MTASEFWILIFWLVDSQLLLVNMQASPTEKIDASFVVLWIHCTMCTVYSTLSTLSTVLWYCTSTSYMQCSTVSEDLRMCWGSQYILGLWQRILIFPFFFFFWTNKHTGGNSVIHFLATWRVPCRLMKWSYIAVACCWIWKSPDGTVTILFLFIYSWWSSWDWWMMAGHLILASSAC